MEYKPMQGKVAVVTGGSGGIGKAISLKLAIAGMKVIILSRNRERGEETIGSIIEKGGEAFFFSTNLAVEKEINDTFTEIIDAFDHVDVLVNNAAISGYMGPVSETPLKELENVLKVNLISIFHLCKLVLPSMIERGFGRIINISSVASRKSPPNSATYNISKAGVNTFTTTLSKEVASYGITVNAVAPGLVLTERIINSRLPGMAGKLGITPEQMVEKLQEDTDTKQLTRVDDVAELVMFLASNVSKNITGEIINISGGY